MIDFKNEQVMRLTEAAKKLDVTYGTIHRWAKYGLNGRKLDSAFLGGTAYTSSEALNRFAGQPTDAAEPVKATMPREHEEAMKRLAQRGALPRRMKDGKAGGAKVPHLQEAEAALAR